MGIVGIPGNGSRTPKKVDFVVWGKLAGWNDLKGHHMVSHLRKTKDKRRVKEALVACRIKPFDTPVAITITWIEPDFRRDPDNIASGGFKIILDALVEHGILPNDTRRWVKEVRNEFAEPCKKDPCVIVTIETFVKEQAA